MCSFVKWEQWKAENIIMGKISGLTQWLSNFYLLVSIDKHGARGGADG
jgi:hypothetical protein